MSQSRTIAAVLALGLMAACQNYSTPTEGPNYVLEYPDGVIADLPHLNPGQQIQLAVKVTTGKGKAVAGVQVTWDDGYAFPTLQPVRALSDSAGLARTMWVMNPLPPNDFAANRVLRAYLPGARNNPIVYRIEVVPCSRC